MLLVGSGGREHALAWRLTQGGAFHDLHAAPGNPGIATLGPCHPVEATDIEGLLALARRLRPDLTVVGPEAPLAAGIADVFQAHRFRLFGPTRLAARLESSKIFAKQLMLRAGIPTARHAVFDRPDEALAYVRRSERPLVVKADGLAAGKGVVVAGDRAAAEEAVTELMVARVHGAAGRRVLIEERLEGRESSVLAFVRGRRVWPMLPAQDYKRIADGDAGPNTGGMGAFAPAPLAPARAAEIVEEVLEPVAAALAADGHPYTGVLYAGVMLTEAGPRVLEFNCRFGDPEAQVILPLLDGDLAAILAAVLDGDALTLRWGTGAAVCVVLASAGYPGPSPTGRPITGLERLPPGVLAFHAGTALRDGTLVTSGGRVLNIVGLGSTLDEARARAYAGVAEVTFAGMQVRRDIGRPAAIAAASAAAATRAAVTP